MKADIMKVPDFEFGLRTEIRPTCGYLRLSPTTFKLHTQIFLQQNPTLAFEISAAFGRGIRPRRVLAVPAIDNQVCHCVVVMKDLPGTIFRLHSDMEFGSEEAARVIES